MNEPHQERLSLSTCVINLGAGGAIGILLGLLVGMSVSPVVASVVGAITAGAIAFMGLRPEAKGNPAASARASVLPQLRIAAFAIGCVAAVLTGVYIRAHDLLGDSMAGRIHAWESTGFNRQEARNIVLFQETGIIPPGWTVDKPAAARHSQGKSVLYDVGSGICNEMDSERFSGPAETLNAWETQGGRWGLLARFVHDQIAPEKQDSTLKRLYGILCYGE